MGFSLQSFAPLREAARLSAPLPSCRYEQPQSSTLRFFWKIMVLRSYRVLLLPMSPYPAGLPPHCQADALLGLGLFRALSGMPWPALPPAFPLALRLRHIPRRTRRRLCLRASMHDPVRGSIAGPPALMRFSTLSRPRCPLKAPRRPYTHIKRTICTSVPNKTSIRVSPDLILYKHSSPSFGSHHLHSDVFNYQKIK